MKKALAVAVLLLAGLIGYNVYTTGEFRLLPQRGTEEQRDLSAIERRLDGLRREVGQAGRAAGLTGTDMTGDVGSIREEVRLLERDLAALKKRLGTDEDRREADRLAAAIRAFRRELD